MEALLTYRGRAVTAEDVDAIRTLITEHPTASRRELSKRLCEVWNWVQQNGSPRDMVCRGLMLALDRAGLIELPPIRRRPPNPLAKRQRPADAAIETTRIAAELCAVQPLWSSGRYAARRKSACSTVWSSATTISPTSSPSAST